MTWIPESRRLEHDSPEIREAVATMMEIVTATLRDRPVTPERVLVLIATMHQTLILSTLQADRVLQQHFPYTLDFFHAFRERLAVQFHQIVASASPAISAELLGIIEPEVFSVTRVADLKPFSEFRGVPSAARVAERFGWTEAAVERLDEHRLLCYDPRSNDIVNPEATKLTTQTPKGRRVVRGPAFTFTRVLETT